MNYGSGFWNKSCALTHSFVQKVSWMRKVIGKKLEVFYVL